MIIAEVTLRALNNKVIDYARRLRRIAVIIECVDARCMATDGPVTPTLREMTQAELSEIYGLVRGV